MNSNIDVSKLNAEELWNTIYGKELKTKKNILEYIELVGFLRKSNVDPERIQDTYNFIYTAINKMSKDVKPNTIMFL